MDGKVVCSACGNPVYDAGRFWDHAGQHRPRHIATPQLEQPGAAWTKDKPTYRGWYCAEDATGMKYMVHVEGGKVWSLLSKHEERTVDDFVWWYGPLHFPYREKS